MQTNDTNNYTESEAVAGVTSNRSKKAGSAKPRPLILVIAVLGLCFYFLPWIRFSVFGFEFYSIIGLDIPTTSEMVGSWSVNLGGSSGGVSVLNLLYLVPLAFIGSIVSEIYFEPRHVALIGLLLTLLIVLFIFGLIYNIGFEFFKEIGAVGLYGSLITSVALLISKNW